MPGMIWHSSHFPSGATGMGSLNVGILAIWNDVRPESDADYETWFCGEHLRERVGILGFQFGRRYVAVDGRSPRYFTYYETTGPGVLRSAAYAERVANPTPLTRHVMANVVVDMIRTVCVRDASDGALRGSQAVVVRASTLSASGLAATWPQVLALPGRVRSELWLSAETGQAASVEEQIRGRDQKIAASLLVEFNTAALAASAASTISALLAGKPEIAIGAYQLYCTLDQRDLRS